MAQLELSIALFCLEIGGEQKEEEPKQRWGKNMLEERTEMIEKKPKDMDSLKKEAM